MTKYETTKTIPHRYLRISEGLFDNPKLAEIADDHGPVVYTVWIFLLCNAKSAGHWGKVIAKPVRLSRRVGLDVKTTEAIIARLVECRSLTPVEGDKEWHFEIRNWQLWQSMTSTERSRKNRLEKKTKVQRVSVPLQHENVVPLRESVPNDTQSRVEESRVDKEECTNVHLSESIPDPLNKLSDDIEKKTIDKRPREVFDHWVALTSKKGRKPVLDEKRRAAIKSRLTQGYTVQQLKDSLSGFWGDDWYNGNGPSGKVYMEISRRLGNAAQVDKGLDLHERQRGTEMERAIYVRPQIEA